jgi:hypothetical protein
MQARNLAADPRVPLHLGDGEDVVIVHGVLLDLDTPALHPHVTTAFEARYTRPGDQPYLPRADPCFDVLDLIGSATATLTATAGVTDHR